MNKLGRKISLVSSLLICGVVCIAGGFIPERIFWIQILCFLIGKMAITSSFTIIFVYSGKFKLYKHKKKKFIFNNIFS
jgi:OCT family organic cation transporter-like MFS transporter 4/5